MKRRKLRKNVKRILRGIARLIAIIVCLVIATYIMGICIKTVVNKQEIHDQIEEEIFNNTYGKNIKVVPEVQKWKKVKKNSSKILA